MGNSKLPFHHFDPLTTMRWGSQLPAAHVNQLIPERIRLIHSSTRVFNIQYSGGFQSWVDLLAHRYMF